MMYEQADTKPLKISNHYKCVDKPLNIYIICNENKNNFVYCFMTLNKR